MPGDRAPPVNTLISIGPDLWAAYAAFNTHAFPGELGNVAHYCAVRLAVLMKHAKHLPETIDSERQAIAEDAAQFSELVLGNPDQIFVMQADGIAYISALHGLLNTAKSFLDVYGALMGRTISPNATFTFKRAKVGESKVSGGSIINWLRGSAPKDFSKAPNLADVIYRNSVDWITEAVAHRDTVSHYSEIKGFRHLHVPLIPQQPCFRNELVREPTMPDGTPLRDYGKHMVGHVVKFMEETVPLLPNINQDEMVLENLREHCR